MFLCIHQESLLRTNCHVTTSYSLKTFFMKKLLNPRLMLILSMTIFGTIGVFVRSIPVSSGELALYRAVLAAVLIGVFLLLTKQKILMPQPVVNDLYNKYRVLYRHNWRPHNIKRLYSAVLCYVQQRYDNFFSYCHINYTSHGKGLSIQSQWVGLLDCSGTIGP